MENQIRNLEIQNFKSIKYLQLDCKQVNIFIGEPNVGKSNILEKNDSSLFIEYIKGNKTELKAKSNKKPYKYLSNYFNNKQLTINNIKHKIKA